MSTVKEKSSQARPEDTSCGSERSHGPFEGKVVSVHGDRLVMKNGDGKEFAHTLPKDATVTRDGNACRACDLKAGDHVRVTTKKNDHNVATAVEVLEQDSALASCCG